MTQAMRDATPRLVRTWFDDLHLSATRSTLLAAYSASTVDLVDPPSPPSDEPVRTTPFVCP